MKTILSAIALVALSGGYIYGAEPVFKSVPTGTVLSAISDNGRWALSSNSEDRDEAGVVSNGGKLWDTQTMTSVSVALPASGIAAIADVTDDGQIVVGSYDSQPGFWSKSTNKWTTLPLPGGCSFGHLLAVTPDGRKAVGYANLTSEFDAVPLYYDLETGKLIELTNVPTVNMNHEKSDYSAFTGISADGRYILGRLSPEVLMPISMCAYIYDTQTDKVNYIAFTPSATAPWTPVYPDLLFIEEAAMSPDGRYVTGSAYLGHEQAGDSDFLDEYRVAFKYDVQSGKAEIFDGIYDADIFGFSITNDGTLLAATPAVNPYASFLVRSGDYYFGLDDICKQVYGFDFYQKTGFQVTGKPVVTSANGKTICVVTQPTESYLLSMTDDWQTVCSKVNLLSNYTVNPPSGSIFSSLSEMKLSFARNVEIAGSASRIKILDADGTELRSAAKAEASGNEVTISFRALKFEAGKQYTVVIPSNLISMVGNINVTADAIRVNYIGRSDGSVKPVAISPESGSSLSRLDASTNPIVITFDASVTIADGARAQLWRSGETAAFAELDLTLAGHNTLLVYPLSRQYLYDGTDYKVVIPAATVTDLGGDGGNAEIKLYYHGTYIREISADDKFLFSDDCSSYANFMFYEGDHLAPGAVAAGWGFTADNPWFIVRSSDETTAMAYAAHSMFERGGKADDWCVTPQIYIPDSQCYLSFDAQSYKFNKADRLKVYAYESNNVYSTLNATIIDDIRKNGHLIFDEQLTPGKSEEELENDWVNYIVTLNEFAGKNIYIAFVNDNENQSAVFLNKVEVIHDMKFLTTITSPSAVIAAKSTPISGSITIASALLEANKIGLTLLDSEGVKVSSLEANGLELKAGQVFNFTFPDELPLKPDVANRFIINVTINGDETSSASSVIKNLAFESTKRVVIEEYSGRECSNCPQGFAAMDNLERLFPERILPVVLRTYENDPLGQGMHDYTEFLGLNLMGAPSAIINRTVSCYPMVSVGTDYRFSGEGISLDGEKESQCWLDVVNLEMETLADADIDFTATSDGKDIIINGNARWALNTDLCNVNILAIVTEDKVESIQMNGMYMSTDPDLGEWAGDGKFATRFPTVNIDGVGRSVAGQTFNGTPGLIPSKLTAGVEYPINLSCPMPETVANKQNVNVILMMIDSDTDGVINANIAHVSVTDAIEEVTDESDFPVEYYDLQGRRVANPSKGSLVIRRQGSKVSKMIY